MMEIGQVIKDRGRDELYDYYKSLGYDHKTSAALALFTYGSCRYRQFSIEKLYDALCKGDDYLPPEVLKERKRRGRQKVAFLGAPRGGGMPMPSVPLRAMRTGGAVSERIFAAPEGGKRGSGIRKLMSFATDLRDQEEEIACYDSAVDTEEYEEYEAGLLEPARGSMPSMMELAGAMGFATDEYESIEEKDAKSTVHEPTSNFRMTTNTASAGVVLNQLRNGRRIDSSMVRIEEMLNYFRYESELPDEEMFNIAYELMDAEGGRKYLYVNVQGREEVKDKQNIVILLDVSGSMSGNATQTQAIVATILSKLGNGDKLSLVTYSNEDHVELEAFSIEDYEDRIQALEKLLSIQIDGGTYGSKGIEEAYRIGKKYYIEGGNNQVILITDGDLNFGITDKGGLEELIERKKKDNLFLSVIGTGLFNYKDDKLETLSKHGNGVYRTVNSLTDIKKSVDEEYSSLVNIIAKDVKAQVEFNPEVVASYRLLGFENRTITHDDFRNDKVISEPFGSGGYGVALYELWMKTGDEPAESGLKYSRLVTTGSKEAGTIRIRYKEPLEDVSHELEKVVETGEASYTDNLRLAFIVYVCAEKLRGSDKISDEEIKQAKKLYKELGSVIMEKNSADLFKLLGILEKNKTELGIGIPDEPFPW